MGGSLFDRDGLCEVPGHVDVVALCDGDVVGQELEWDDVEETWGFLPGQFSWLTWLTRKKDTPWRQSTVFGTRMMRFVVSETLMSVSLAMMIGAPLH